MQPFPAEGEYRFANYVKHHAIFFIIEREAISFHVSSIIFMELSHGRSQGGSWGARDPPFRKPF